MQYRAAAISRRDQMDVRLVRVVDSSLACCLLMLLLLLLLLSYISSG